MLFAVPAIAAEDEHAGHHPDQGEATTAAAPDQRMQEMQARMQEIRETQDPEARKRLMDEQMAAMESMMEHMQGMDGGMPGKGMHDMGKGGMGRGMMQRGPGGGMDPAMMQQRREMMQRCMAMQGDMAPSGASGGHEGQ
jgi:hypothetical protein